MTINKRHDEFYTLDMERGWEVPVGYPAGIEQKIISGALDETSGGTGFGPFTYACRPPGAHHGPFRSEKGCLLLEVHYFDPA